MFSLMGNCISSIRGKRQPKKPVTLALLGVDNAGKTTASLSLSGEPMDENTAPTIGFRNFSFSFEKYDITLYDVGGGKNIRPVWKNYFPEVYAFIFVVDSSTTDRMEETRETFRESLEHPQVSGKPLLLLANKQDKPDALDEVDICEMLNLESVVNSNKCPCRIEACSAIKGSGRKMDRSLKEGLRWLLAMIDSRWEELKTRVDSDMKAAAEAQKIEAAARRERVRKQREERERKEQEEQQRLGLEEKKKDDGDEDGVDGNPFKPLDFNELKKKEEALKAEKKRYKELKETMKEQQPSQEALFTKVPDSTRSRKAGSYMETSEPNDVGEEEVVERIFTPREDGERVFSPRAVPSSLPPLKPLGTPFLEDGEEANNKKKKKKKKTRTPRSTHPSAEQSGDRTTTATTEDNGHIVIATPRSQPVLTNSHTDHSSTTLSNIRVSTHDDFPSREMLAAGITRMPRPLDGGDAECDQDTPRTRKVKKKRLRQLGAARQNGKAAGGDLELTPRPQPLLTSLDGGDIYTVGTDSLSHRGKKQVWKSGLEPTEEETEKLSARGVPSKESNNNLSADRRPVKLSRNSQMHSNISIESDHMGSKSWGLAEDLPAVDNDSVAFRQPNVMDDKDVVL
ncbi:uncharacterized protein LOC143297986 [Babylonia areolata]|uniref:uncharacterized protein LOC143297986 n=1 Tax=Babylonia areolata TaxID=304850 RepID=UPI003FD1B1B4